MAGRGPAPQPTALKLLRGNPGKRKINKQEPQPDVVAPPMPSWLSRGARSEWRYIVPILLRVRCLTEADRTALAAYCQATAELKRATLVIEREGLMLSVPVLNKAGFPVTVPVKDASGKVTNEPVVAVKAHPAVKLQRDAFRQVKTFIEQFGLSPSSRSRVKIEGPAETADPLEALRRRAKGS